MDFREDIVKKENTRCEAETWIARGEKSWIQYSRICQNSKPSIKKSKENGAAKATEFNKCLEKVQVLEPSL